MRIDRLLGLNCAVSTLALIGAAGAAAIVPVAAQAQAADGQDISIAAGDLAVALQQYSAQTGVQLVYSSELVAGKRSPGVSGHMTRGDALAALLAGTGLTAQLSGNSATLMKIGDAVAPGEGERVLGAVRVQGSSELPYFGGQGRAAGVNGINGSRDITATEDTGSFTSGALTIGSKVPQAIKDVPQSLSVLTNERLVEQNVTDFTSAMRQLPGVTLVQGGTSLETTFLSRGFTVQSIQVDGGAPLLSGAGGTFQPQIDMSIYDHVELLRGAAGLFNGYGDPSGSVNLVRKMPLDHAQFVVDASAGSWSNYRVVADATAPLALNGKLRGRLVMTWQDNHHFYKLANDNKILIYGVGELDATPTTLLTVGATYTRQNSLPWQNGLPRYLTGDDLRLPRSTSLALPWNRWNFETREIFGSIGQKLGGEWEAKLNLTQVKQTSVRKIGQVYGGVNPGNDIGPMLYGSYASYENNQLAADATISGAVKIFGQRQEIVIGANRALSDSSGGLSYGDLITSSPSAPYQPYSGGPSYCYDYGAGTCPAGTLPFLQPPVNVFSFNPNDPIYTEPRNTLPIRRDRANKNISEGAYLSLRLTAFDILHVTTGLRWSKWVRDFASDLLCTSTVGACSGKNIGDVRFTFGSGKYSNSNFSWPPPINVSLDVTKDISVYGGYTDIYNDNSSALDVRNQPLPPITGANMEAGVKWALRGGRLNITVSGYKIRQHNLPVIDSSVPFTEVDAAHTCCWLVDPQSAYKSEGLEFEITGEIRKGWQVSGSYSNSVTKVVGNQFFGSVTGLPFASIQPKNLYKIWTTYDFGATRTNGFLSGLAISLGVNGQSSGYQQGAGCKPEYLVPDPTTGIASCAPGGSFSYAFTVPAYAVVSGRVDYRLSKVWSMGINLENILDKTYYQTTGGGVEGGNWYGNPRSVTFILRGKF